MGLGKQDVGSFCRFSDVNTQWRAKRGPPDQPRVGGWKKTCLHKAFKTMKSPEQPVGKMGVAYEEGTERVAIGNE